MLRSLPQPLPFLWICLVLAAFGAGCGSSESPPGSQQSTAPDGELAVPYRAVATVGMIGDIVKNIAGDRANVSVLIGAGSDPHLYTPTRGDLAKLLDADIIFYNGLLLEGRLTDALMRTGRQKPVYAVTEMLDEDYVIGLGEGDDAHPDPHVWMDVQGWLLATGAVEKALSEFDPAGAETYAANAQTYRETLQALDDYTRTAIASIPQGQRVLVTAHDAFNYMGRAYDLEVMGIQGLSTESEASLQDINRLVDLLVERQIPAVFVESTIADKNVRALIEGARAKGHDVRIGGSLFSDAMGKEGTYEGTYVGMIDNNATLIARALGGEAPVRGMQGQLSQNGPE
ncbi:MAG: zinc ABC transporter substrate-binding protein [Sumerlaeia bacterium]